MLDILEKNIKALRGDRADTFGLTEILSNAGLPASLSSTFDSRGESALRIISDGAALHSLRNPESEARRQIESWVLSEPHDFSDTVVVFGLGAGWHVREMASRMSRRGRLVVIDPSPADVRLALELFDLSEILQSGAFFIFSSDLGWAAREFCSILIKLKAESQQFSGAHFFVHPRLESLHRSRYSELISRCRRAAAKIDFNTVTASAHAELWTVNSITNLPFLMSGDVSRAFGLTHGGTAIVAGAGPSLAAAIPFVREARSHAALISVGTAYAPLLKASLPPDFVVQVDAKPNSVRMLDHDDNQTFLAFSPVVDPMIPRLFGRRAFPFLFEPDCLPGFSEWLRHAGISMVHLACAGTVAVPAIDLARRLGFDNIILVGMDFCLGVSGQTHSEGTLHQTSTAVENLVEIPGNRTPAVMTRRDFALYAEQVGAWTNKWAGQGVVVFNANPGGARIDGALLAEPKDIARLASEHPTDAAGFALPLEKCSLEFHSHSKCLSALADTRRTVELFLHSIEKSVDAERRLSSGDQSAIHCIDSVFEHVSQLWNKAGHRHLTGLLEGFTHRQSVLSELCPPDSPASTLRMRVEFLGALRGACGKLLAALDEAGASPKT